MPAQVTPLHNTIKQLAKRLLLCEEAWSINDTIAAKAHQINARKLNTFFAPVQYALFQTFALDICKLFEVPTKKYDLYSIPAAIRLLPQSNIKHPQHLAESLLAYGLPQTYIDTLSEHNLVSAYADEITKQLDQKDVTDKLAIFKTIRDKWIAHSEVVIIDKSFRSDDAKWLLQIAKRFVSIVGLAFLDIIFADGRGTFISDEVAQRAAYSVRSILEYIGIIALERTSDEVRARMLVEMIQKAEWSETVKEEIRQSLS